jgi:hypothetical protein
MDTTAVNFGEVPANEPTPYRIRARVHVPTSGLHVEASPPICDIQAERTATIPGGSEYILTLIPRASLPTGRFEGTLAIRLQNEIGERFHGATLKLEGTRLPAVRLLPAKVFLPPIPLGKTQSADVMVQSPAGQSVEVEHWETDSNDTQIELVRSPDLPAGRVFRITQRATKEGDHRVTVRFLVRIGGRKAEPLTTEVYFQGHRGRE